MKGFHDIECKVLYSAIPSMKDGTVPLAELTWRNSFICLGFIAAVETVYCKVRFLIFGHQ